MNRVSSFIAAIALSTTLASAQEADEGADLAKQLANPVSSLISVPVQANYDQGFGPNGAGSMWRINVQPVIPFSLTEDWNLISRTILPLVEQDNIPAVGLDDFGLGDTVQSFFFSPVDPVNGWILGGGPVFLIPTATDDLLGSERWGVGPTFVALKQTGPWTVGALANHIASFGGNDNRADINATFLQPFLSYITESKTTFSLNTEATFDWQTDNWSVPLNFNISQLLLLGGQPVQVGGGLRYWAESPRNGPEGWGARIQITLLFPKN